MKRRMAGFMLPPGTECTTSNLDNCVMLLGDSGANFAPPVAGCDEKTTVAMNNLAVTHAIKAETPHITSLFVEIQPAWTILNINALLL